MARRVNTFSSFGNRSYRFFFLGMVGQWASFSMEMVPRTLLIYQITGSAAMLGFLALASAIPMILLSLFGGAIADRMPKKRLIQLSQVVMTLMSLSVALTISTGYLGPEHKESWWVLMANGVVMGIVMALAMPSRQAIIPEIVGKAQLMNAISLNTMGMSVFRLVGPGLAGVVVDKYGFAAVFYIMTAMNLAAIVFTSFLPKVAPSPTRRSVLSGVIEGLKYMRGHTTLLLILGFFVVSILLSMPYQMMLPIFTEDILKVGVTGQGALMSVSGVGALVASVTLASLPSRRRGLVLIISNLTLGLALVAFSFSRSWPLSLGLMVFVGIGQIGNNTAGAALLQSHTEPEYLGRVMSIMMMNFGLSSLGTFFAGLAAEGVGAEWAIGSFAAILTFTSVAAFLFVPRLKNLD